MQPRSRARIIRLAGARAQPGSRDGRGCDLPNSVAGVLPV